MIKALKPVITRINQLEVEFRSLSQDALRAKVAKWKEELKPLEWGAQQEYLDRILPEAFAAVKNAAWRLTEAKAQFTVCEQPMTWAMVHFDTQLIGGYCLHKGMIAEMATGEGKTLVATLPLFERPHGTWLAPRHHERLPRPTRRGMDGATLPIPRPHRRHHPARPVA